MTCTIARTRLITPFDAEVVKVGGSSPPMADTELRTKAGSTRV